MNIHPTTRRISAPLVLCSIFALLAACGGESNRMTASSGEATGVIVRSAAGTHSSDGNATSSTQTIEQSIASSEMQTSSTGVVSQKDTIAPTAPETISKLTPTTTSIELSWTPANDNTGVVIYKVYRNKALVATLAADALSYKDNTVKPNSLYTYSVVAGDAAGNWSELKSLLAQTPVAESSSSAIQVIIEDSSSSAPASAAVSSIPKPKSSSATSVANSKISSSTPTSSKIAVSSSSKTKVSSNSSVTKSAINSSVISKSSAASSKAAKDIQAPVITSNILKKALTETSVSLAWGAAIDNVGVTGYKIYKDQKLVATLDANQLSYVDGGLKQDSGYTFSVSAGDAADNWSAPKAISMKTLKSTGATLKWLIPTERENGKFIAPMEIAGYEIRYKRKNDAEFTSIFIKNGSAESYSIPNLQGDYEFTIAAYDVNDFYSEFVPITPI